jgi:hypothetical protein
MSYAIKLSDGFSQHADQEKASAMEKYMRDQFRFFGIKPPERKEITKQFLKQHGRPDHLKTTILELWTFEERELLYAAIDILLLEKKAWAAGHRMDETPDHYKPLVGYGGSTCIKHNRPPRYKESQIAGNTPRSMG